MQKYLLFRVMDFFLCIILRIFVTATSYLSPRLVGCMYAFFPNPQQLEIFDASSEQICCSTVRLVPCALLAQFENYLNK